MKLTPRFADGVGQFEIAEYLLNQDHWGKRIQTRLKDFEFRWAWGLATVGSAVDRDSG